MTSLNHGRVSVMTVTSAYDSASMNVRLPDVEKLCVFRRALICSRHMQNVLLRKIDDSLSAVVNSRTYLYVAVPTPSSSGLILKVLSHCVVPSGLNPVTLKVPSPFCVISIVPPVGVGPLLRFVYRRAKNEY